jgi:hypothetical protein
MGAGGPAVGDAAADTAAGGTPASWRHLLVPAGAPVVEVPRGYRSRRRVAERLAEVAPGARVVLVSGRPAARWGIRRLLRAGGLDVEREYVALPSLRGAVYLAEDARPTIRWLCRAVLTVPPGTARLAVVVDVALRLARRVVPWRAVGAVAPGRVVVGRRP